MSKHIHLSLENSIAFITLSRPAVNAFDAALVQEFHSVLDELAAHPEIRVISLRSDQKAFCAGADLAMVSGFLADVDPSSRLRHYASTMQKLFLRLEGLPAVTVCEIAGSAMGGGMELALAADFRLTSSRAKFGLPEIALGLIPAAGGTQRTVRTAGLSVARKMILGGQIIGAAEALDARLVDHTFPDEEFAQRAVDFVARLARQPAAALRAAKRCLAHAQPAQEAGFNAEVEEIGGLISRAEARVNIQVFLEKMA